MGDFLALEVKVHIRFVVVEGEQGLKETLVLNELLELDNEFVADIGNLLGSSVGLIVVGDKILVFKVLVGERRGGGNGFGTFLDGGGGAGASCCVVERASGEDTCASDSEGLLG